MALGAAPNAPLEALAEMHTAALADPRRVVLVAEQDGDVVGMAHVAPSEAANASHRAEVQRVAVAEHARGLGVGRALMRAAEDEARARGVTLLWLTTHDGTEACAFYEAIGYARLGVMPAYSLRPDGTPTPAAFYFRELR